MKYRDTAKTFSGVDCWKLIKHVTYVKKQNAVKNVQSSKMSSKCYCTRSIILFTNSILESFCMLYFPLQERRLRMTFAMRCGRKLRMGSPAFSSSSSEIDIENLFINSHAC